MPAMAAVPSNANPLPSTPIHNAIAHLLDQADDLVPGNARVLDAGKRAELCERVAVADAAGLDLDEDLARAGRWDVALNRLEWTIGFFHLQRPHACHGSLHQMKLEIVTRGNVRRGDRFDALLILDVEARDLRAVEIEDAENAAALHQRHDQFRA